MVTTKARIAGMIIVRGDAVDFDYDLFASVARALDAHIERLERFAAETDIDPDQLIFDDADHTFGLGFAAAQTYIAGVCRWTGISKSVALSVGPSGMLQKWLDVLLALCFHCTCALHPSSSFPRMTARRSNR